VGLEETLSATGKAAALTSDRRARFQNDSFEGHGKAIVLPSQESAAEFPYLRSLSR
jgi:hypothetical protein